MSHLPVNHHLRPVYRTVAGLTGVWLIAFGAVGWSQTQGSEWFERGDWSALGLPTNRAFATVSLAAGAIVLVAALVGRNVDRLVNLWGGAVFLTAGTAMMTVAHTDLNVLNFSIVTSMASYAIGLILLAAGLYGKVGTAEEAAAEEALRHGTG
jgi:hypothetical protein